jgi:hypothetical protein
LDYESNELLIITQELTVPPTAAQSKIGYSVQIQWKALHYQLKCLTMSTKENGKQKDFHRDGGRP